MLEQLKQKTPNTNIDKLEGIDILVEWAKSGNIDPWDIDIVQITDMFLAKLMELKQNNLRLTGRTLFYAAVLLKIKSDILEGLDPFKEEAVKSIEDFDPDLDMPEEDFNAYSNAANVISLENAITRRTSVRKNRFRKVTLEDLIKQIQKLEAIDKQESHKATTERIKARRSYTNFTPDEIVDLAHEEQLEDEVTKLQNILSKLFESEEKIKLEDLIEAGMDKVNAYLSLLFLTARSRIDLVQEEFYSDLYIINEVNQ
ncbi:MAG: segregation/condensation protein A [Vampirovibrionia bacterium]